MRLDDLATMAQSRNGLPLARVLTTWLARVLDAKPGEGALCLTCDAEFRGEPSWSAMVAAPFAGEGEAIVTAICPACAGHPNLEGVIVGASSAWSVRRRPSGGGGSGAELMLPLPVRRSPVG